MQYGWTFFALLKLTLKNYELVFLIFKGQRFSLKFHFMKNLKISKLLAEKIHCQNYLMLRFVTHLLEQLLLQHCVAQS